MKTEKNIEERMLEAWKNRKTHKTIFAIASALIPFIGFLLAFGVHYLLPPDTDAGHMGLRDFYYMTSILMLSFLIGALSGVIALVRREKNQKLVIAGLLLNGIPLFLAFIYSPLRQT